MSAARQRKPKIEDHLQEDHSDDEIPHAKKGEEGEGPWLISYADLMTLLMGFFALVSSFSSPDKKNFEKVRESAAAAFGAKLEKPYQMLVDRIAKFVRDHKLEDKVTLKQSADGVEITFTGTMFFDSGDFRVKPEASTLLEELAKAIKQEPNNYRALIEGHTDSVPISHPIISSNWELSGLRASRIAQLFEKNGFSKETLTIIGWGETKPIVTNTTADGSPILENMSKNRRVVVRIYDRKYSDDPIRE